MVGIVTVRESLVTPLSPLCVTMMMTSRLTADDGTDHGARHLTRRGGCQRIQVKGHCPGGCFAVVCDQRPLARVVEALDGGVPRLRGCLAAHLGSAVR